MKRVVITVSNDLVTDQRLLRMAAVFSDKGYSVLIAGRELPGSIATDRIPFRHIRYRMIFRRGMLFYKFLNIRHLFLLLKEKPDVIVSIDLDTLLPASIVARLYRRPLVYDSHEYFTGTPDLQKRSLVRWVWKLIEKYSFGAISHLITVNDSIAGLYSDEYGMKAHVVRNIGNTIPVSGEAEGDIGIGEDTFLMVMHGTGINPGRGGIEAVKAIEILKSNRDKGSFHLLVIGRGDEVPLMKDYVAEKQLYDEVTFLAPMPWSDLTAYLKRADAGLCLDSGDAPNSLYSLPNKIFDYLRCELAIISTRLPEIVKIVDGKNCALLIDNNHPESIAEAAISLSGSPEMLQKMKHNSGVAAGSYRWEDEKVILENLIDDLERTK